MLFLIKTIITLTYLTKTIEFLRHATEKYAICFTFDLLDYIGKYKTSKKAINMALLSVLPKTV